MSDAYRPPTAELRETLASARPFRNAVVGFGTSLVALLVPMASIYFSRDGRPFLWDRAALVVLVPSLLVAIAAAALPRPRARAVMLWAIPGSLLVSAVVLSVTMRWVGLR